VVERLAGPLAPHAFVVVPQPIGLSTAEVYREADRLALPRTVADLGDALARVRSAVRPGAELPTSLFANDLEPAAVSLRPEIGRALRAVRDAGAAHAMVSGSGPTVLGLCWGAAAEVRAASVAGALADRYPGATAAVPVTQEFGDPRGT
jgi:4-diphosphocytidyl-2-C-methyl-D-erythritol kinase